MEILAGIGDFLVKIFPVIAGILIYLIPTAKERLERKTKVDPVLPIVQGKTIDYTEELMQELREKADDAAELARLREILRQNGISYDDDTN